MGILNGLAGAVMRFVTITGRSNPRTLVGHAEGWSDVQDVAPSAPWNIEADLYAGSFAEVCAMVSERLDPTSSIEHFPPLPSSRLAPATALPRKAWGVGLNFGAHASDLDERPPEAPAWFIKADHTISGPGEAIRLPAQSERVTTEAELGIVIGRECRDVSPAEALEYVAGVCSILDQTAEDILRRNPRFLTWAKNYPTFLIVGPELVTLDEFLDRREMRDVTIETIKNGEVVARGTVADMTFSPAELISHFSTVMPLHPGDLLATGTPGAAAISSGDVVTARISGLNDLSARVVEA